ncbi:SDR family NAD(P)-dependent oxidoreductase [Phaeocystidibacter marisrubri]|uniref:SDR family NAD(P)-dependent oxidoreductase n=1 Tax=Phaeocystidibacter marisrubri TaxID=1577780 RepID=A0A6L3ZEU4_9FLAO|nr:SDR family NAD(P)-dependent oxidoreductase [Phaeocystidibacter marisrubri]KAB2816220.1 SDR family NAD(P)-dependent oxidoreductase [Phaeocystidibacter marisrubri]GGH67921.1 short-chain dehydrogenase [Phaeocystidibacter marisrubri]
MAGIALVTGATSGIGEATALRLADEGYDIIATGRRENRLNTLREKIETKGRKCMVYPLDVRVQSDVQNFANRLPDEWKKIDVLVNNAGLAAGKGPIQEGNLDHWERMIDTNVKGLLYVSKAIIPFMTSRKKGHIINIGSIAGKEVYPGGNVYNGTKHAVDALTRGMRIDLIEYGIRVSQIAPGMVETEFSLVRFDGDQQKADETYHGFDPLLAEDIADAVAYQVTRPPHVNVADMLILPTAQASAIVVKKEE